MILPGRTWLILLAAAFLLAPAADGANALSELRGLRTRESRIPVYSRDRLQLLLYSAEGIQKGRILETISPVLDIIRSDADVDTIDTGKNTRIYPLGSAFADVFKFWSGHLFSDGVVVTDKADIDQENKLAAGGGPVFSVLLCWIWTAWDLMPIIRKRRFLSAKMCGSSCVPVPLIR